MDGKDPGKAEEGFTTFISKKAGMKVRVDVE
jgi:hypothetical protein